MNTARRLTNLLPVLLVFLTLAVPAGAATKITSVTSPGGITAWLVENPAIPIISVEVVWRVGAKFDPPDRPGVANMLSGLLDEGAGELDSQAFQTRLKEMAIRLSFDSGKDQFSGTLKTLSDNRDEAFRLLRLAITEPRFDAEPVERIRGQIMAGLTRKAADPDYIAGRTWFKNAFPEHPYGRPTQGTLESVKAITAGDLRDFVQNRLARDNMVIGVVGDITADELSRRLDEVFGRLPARAAIGPVPETLPTAGGSLTVIEKDIPQSVVIFGGPGMKRDDPDYYAAYVMNYILGGGGLTSRLMLEIREKRGLAYSVYSYLAPYDHTGLFMGGVATANARVAKSIDLVREELARLRAEGVTEQELSEAKTYLNGSFPLRLTTNGRIAGMLTAIQVNRLGIDYLDKRAGYIDAVTLDDVKRVAERLLHPGNLNIVVVGKPENLSQGG